MSADQRLKEIAVTKSRVWCPKFGEVEKDGISFEGTPKHAVRQWAETHLAPAPMNRSTSGVVVYTRAHNGNVSRWLVSTEISNRVELYPEPVERKGNG